MLLQKALDLVLPRKCLGCQEEGTWLCRPCFSLIRLPNSFHCPLCGSDSGAGLTCHKHGAASIDGMIISGYYHDTILRRAIHQFKYGPSEELGKELGKIIARAAAKFHNLLPNEALIIPIPQSGNRAKLRGFNHTEILANYVAQALEMRLATTALKRSSQNIPQAGLPENLRRQNVVDAFYVNDPKLVLNKNVVLVDDVSTTGATLEIAARALKNTGATSVFSIVLARG